MNNVSAPYYWGSLAVGCTAAVMLNVVIVPRLLAETPAAQVSSHAANNEAKPAPSTPTPASAASTTARAPSASPTSAASADAAEPGTTAQAQAVEAPVAPPGQQTAQSPTPDIEAAPASPPEAATRAVERTEERAEAPPAPLPTILFASGSAALDRRAEARLDEVAEVLASRPETRIMLLGHTDRTGTWEVNQALSEQRAEAVRDALQERGIKKRRMTVRGLGHSEQLGNNPNASRNRRVEIFWR